MVKEAVKADSTRLRIPLDSLLMLPAGASYTARSGRAHASVTVRRTGNVAAAKQQPTEPSGMTVYVETGCDSLERLCAYYEQENERLSVANTHLTATVSTKEKEEKTSPPCLGGTISDIHSRAVARRNNNLFNNKKMDYKVLDGTDLILSSMGHALGFSTGCKVSTSAETGERKTKEASSGKWKEQYVKSFSEQITADGVVLTNGTDEVPTYDQLKAAMLKGDPIDAAYNLRDGDKRTGKTAGGYTGKYIITSLELDAQAGDDAKYSITLQNSGPVTAQGSGLTEAAASGTDS